MALEPGYGNSGHIQHQKCRGEQTYAAEVELAQRAQTKGFDPGLRSEIWAMGINLSFAVSHCSSNLFLPFQLGCLVTLPCRSSKNLPGQNLSLSCQQKCLIHHHIGVSHSLRLEPQFADKQAIKHGQWSLSNNQLHRGDRKRSTSRTTTGSLH